MEKKWKIFRIVVSIQFAIIAFCIAVDVYQGYKYFSNPYVRKELSYTHPFFISLYVLIAVIIFDIFCLFLLQKKYPDKRLSSTNVALLILFFILAAISTLVISVITVFGIKETIESWGRSNTKENAIIVLLLLIIITSLIYVLINSIQLKRYIRKTSIANEKEVIDTIGS